MPEYDVHVRYDITIDAINAIDALRIVTESIREGKAKPAHQVASPSWTRKQDIPKENW